MNDILTKGCTEVEVTIAKAESIVEAAKKIMRKRNLNKAMEILRKKREKEKEEGLKKEKE